MPKKKPTVNKSGNKQKKKKKDSLSEDYRFRQNYSRIKIEGFRIFDSIFLDELSNINIFLGRNNSGKSSVLEAIFAHACGLNFQPFRDQILLRRHNSFVNGTLDYGEKLFSTFRHKDKLPFNFKIIATQHISDSEHHLRVDFSPSSELADLDPRNLGQTPLFHQHKSEFETESSFSKIKLPDGFQKLRTDNFPKASLGEWTINHSGKVRKIELTFPPESIQSYHPFKQAFFQDILSHRSPETEPRVFGQLKRYGDLDEFVSNMRKAFPAIREVDIIPFPDGRSGPLLVSTDDNRRLPLYAFGDGVRRWYYLLGNMHIFRNSIHCIEEIDATFHTGAQSLLSQLLLNHAINFSNQIFATSHSIEYMDCFLDALFGPEGCVEDSEPDPVRIFTLRPSDEGFEVWALSGREAFESRDKYKIELRT